MKFEKRSGDEAETPSSAPEETPSTGKKPVVIYIMILFIVAFLLMALSFLMHQRSNSEVLGELQDSVTAMQEVQATQDALLDLQNQLDEAQTTIDAQRKLTPPWRRPSGRTRHCWLCTPFSSSILREIWRAVKPASTPSRRLNTGTHCLRLLRRVSPLPPSGMRS